MDGDDLRWCVCLVECGPVALKLTLSPKHCHKSLAHAVLLPTLKVYAKKEGGARNLLGLVQNVLVDKAVVKNHLDKGPCGKGLMLSLGFRAPEKFEQIPPTQVKIVLKEQAIRSLPNFYPGPASEPKRVCFRAAYINLADRDQRREKTITALAAAGVEASRFEAKTGLSLGYGTPEAAEVSEFWNTRLNASFDKEMMPKDKVPMSSSERGCAASHIALWHHCSWLPDDGPPLLVLEDDLAFTPGFGALVQKLVATVEAKIPVTSRQTLLYLSGEVASWRDVPAVSTDLKDAEGGTVSLREAEYVWQTGSYLIWPTAAKHLIESLPVDAPVDKYLSKHVHKRELRALVCWPLPAMQEAPHEGDVVRSGFVPKAAEVMAPAEAPPVEIGDA